MPLLFLRRLAGPAIFSFAFGVGLFSAGIRDPAPGRFEARVITVQSTEVIPSPTDQVEGTDDLSCWGGESEHPRYGPIQLPGNRSLETICGTLFARESDGTVAWTRNIGAPLSDQPKLVDGELVVIGYDLHLAGIDPATGVLNWEVLANGRSVYTQLEPVGRNLYALLTDMAGYDDTYLHCIHANPQDDSKCWRKELDHVALLSKNKLLRHWSVPANSELEVRGRRIFAVYRRGNREKRIELRR